jgi:branched-chain amino acid aminotransferase
MNRWRLGASRRNKRKKRDLRLFFRFERGVNAAYSAVMGKGTHDYREDPRNAAILININGDIVPRAEAMVSVFDSGFMLGDGVWEGLRVHQGRIAFLDQHMDRLFEGAKAIDMDIGIDRETLERRLYETIDANGESEGVHIRLMVTRGIRSTPYQDPRVVVSPATIVIVPEYKEPLPATVENGIRLFTVHVRRGDPAVQDPKLNSHSKLNCITACIQATKAGADEALMLDPQGFVATCNSTHFFIVRKGEVWTSSGDYCLGGITRSTVLDLCREAGIPAYEKNFSLTDVYGADEAFVTGTFAGVVPVTEVDGRRLTEARGPMVERLQQLYSARLATDTAARSRP